MKNTLNVKMLYQFYHHAVKAELKRNGFSADIAKKNQCRTPKDYRTGKRDWKIQASEFLHHDKLFYCNESQHRKIG